MPDFETQITAETRAAVIGHPIKQSRSPDIHNAWLKQKDISGTYSAIDVPPEELEDFCALLKDSHLKGCNVTLPHKQAIMDYCEDIDDTARKIGAVNTIAVKDQKLYGTNTDAYGFIQNLKEAFPDIDFPSANAVVLGAGGAARAVLYGLKEEGTQNITLTNRTQEKAENLAADFSGIDVQPWEERQNILGDCTLLINTTSLGMHGKGALTLDVSQLPAAAIVYDLIYNPLQTDLLKNAAEKGCKTLHGLGMLVHQAAKSFELWFGETPVIEDSLLKALKESL